MTRTAVPLEKSSLDPVAALDLEAARIELEPLAPQDRLAWAQRRFAGAFALTTSFGIQSAVLLHMVSQLQDGGAIPVIWVDTGYLPPETYHYAQQLTDQLGIRLVVAQSSMSPARMEALHGRLWETGQVSDLETYHRIRKVEPLEQAFASLDVRCWASGVRSGQTDHRRSMTWLDPIRTRLSCGRCSTGLPGMSSITCRSMSCLSTPCLIRAIRLSGIGTPAVRTAGTTAAAAPVSVA